MNAAELFEQLNILDESEKIEAKQARSIGNSIMESICAFANEPDLGGGWLLLGVVRDEQALFPTYIVDGIQDSDKIISDLITQARSTFNTPVRIEARAELLNGKTVIAAFVPEAPPADKPIFFKNKKLPDGAYRRMGPTDQKCSEDDLLALYAGRQGESYDGSVISDSSIDDIDPDALEDYRNMRREANPYAEELRWSDEELLIALGCAKKMNHIFVPTVAGIVLFGKTFALRRLFPMMRVDYIRIPGKEWISDPENRFESIDMRDSLFRVVRRAQALIFEDLPKAFHLPDTSLRREEKPLIPLKVIREALVNAVMHRNYRIHQSIQIIRYSNRLEIRNPGYSLKSPDHLGEPGSMARNPKIAAVLHETNFAETKGSGIRVMRELMEQTGLSLPVFESDRSADTFTARYLFHHFLTPEDLTWLAYFKEDMVTDQEAKALIFIREAGAITNAVYRDLNRVETLEASTRLRRLRDIGLLESKGGGAKTYYVPALRFYESLKVLSGSEEIKSAPSSDQVGTKSAPSQEQFKILNECVQESSLMELMQKTGRTDRTKFRENMIRPLLEAGWLEMTIPEKPTSSKQKYRLSLEGQKTVGKL